MNCHNCVIPIFWYNICLVLQKASGPLGWFQCTKVLVFKRKVWTPAVNWLSLSRALWQLCCGCREKTGSQPSTEWIAADSGTSGLRDFRSVGRDRYGNTQMKSKPKAWCITLLHVLTHHILTEHLPCARHWWHSSLTPGLGSGGRGHKLKVRNESQIVAGVKKARRAHVRLRRGILTQCGKGWLDGITDSMDMSLSYSGRWWRTGKPAVLQSMGSQRVWTWLSEQ